MEESFFAMAAESLTTKESVLFALAKESVLFALAKESVLFALVYESFTGGGGVTCDSATNGTNKMKQLIHPKFNFINHNFKNVKPTNRKVSSRILNSDLLINNGHTT